MQFFTNGLVITLQGGFRIMNATNNMQGIRTIIYPVKDIAKAKALFSTLLGVEPYMDEPYYVGFRVGDQDIGLDPNGHKQGLTGPLAYFHVSDIKNSLQSLLDAGAQVIKTSKMSAGVSWLHL